MKLDELAALFDPGAATEVRVVDDAGLTTAIYSHRRVIEVGAQLDGNDVRRVYISLQIEPIEQSAADILRERLDAQAEKLAQLASNDSARAAEISAQKEQMDRYTAQTELVRAQIQAVSDRGEFVEDCLAEMATAVYS
ncbi:hypothetical protein [Beduinella massiliensis]|uniref:hypothetical protein n=1 Tax=Beduinella massiliensis TaxID=1852363 RepID=UPI000C83A10F